MHRSITERAHPHAESGGDAGVRDRRSGTAPGRNRPGAGHGRAARRAIGLVAAGVLGLGTAGCSVNVHRTSSTSSPASRGISVPLKVVTNGHAVLEIVPVRVAGQGPYDFMLDTGSSVSSIDRRLVTKLHLKRTGATKQIRGVASTTTIPLVAVPTWTLGTAQLAPEKIGEVDLSKTGGGKVAGLLGSDQLKSFGAITVDFQAGRLRLAHAQR